MADNVGIKTNKKTQTGRDVYKTPEGEMVSEKSTTFKYKGQWINIPSIHEGNRYDDDTLILMLEAGLIEPTSVHKNKEEAEQAARKRSDSLKFNQGGTPMLEQQMELFEDGGLRDEGGEVDEVSGNEVPVGGTKKGVRDDVPAMVSEGEFVFPEDVTRYIGLDKLMQMRQEAKMGLKRMDAMGQMGNGDEATMPDDMPFGMADLIVVAGDTGEELEMQEGGFVTRPTTVTRTEQQPTYAEPPVEPAPEFRSTRALTPSIERPARPDIDFSKIMGDANIEFKEYRNEEGTSTLVAFIGGKPVYPIPDGYTLYTEEDAADKTEEAVVKANAIVPEKDKYEMPDFLKPKPPEPKNWATMPTDELIDELGSVTGTSRLITKGALLLMGPVGIAGSFMMKDQDKNIVVAIDAALARGGLSSEDTATLTAAKEELTKSGMLDFLDPIIDGVAGALGLSTEKVDNSVNTAVATGAVQESLRPRARPAAEEPAVEEQKYTSTGAQMQASQRALQDIVPAPEPAETTDAGSYLSQRLASSQGGDSFTGGDYDVASNDPNFVSDADDKFRKDLPEVRKAFYGDESATPQVEITQQPTATFPQGYPVDNQVGISAGTTTQPFEPIVNASPRKTDVVTTGMQLAPVQPDLSAVPEYMDTDTGTPSYGPVPAAPRVPRRFTGADPFNVEDTSNTLAAFDLSPAPQESGTFTKDGISMLPSADVSDLTTEAYIASQQPASLQEQALNLLSPEAQTRVLNKDIDATIANAKKVISNSSDDQGTVPKPQAPAPAAISDPRIDVSRQPFIDAPYPQAPVAAPLRSFSDATSMAKRKALAARPTPLVTTEEPVKSTKSFEDLEAEYSTSPALKSETFNEAFARNKKDGKKTFTYRGKKYITETKEEKAAKKEAAKPKRDTGSKSNRLDQSNPNSEINFNEHLADWEKAQARSDPNLARHFILTANRRENEKKKTGKDPADKVSAKKHDESGGLGGVFKGLFGAQKGGLATRR